MSAPPGPRQGSGPARIAGLSPARWALILVGLHALLGLLLYDPTLFTGGDNAGYMILGDALRSGQGYRDVHLPDVPVHTRYPPGYPAILALLGWVGRLQLFKIFSLACTSLSVWLLYRLGARISSEWTGVLAAGVMALNPVLLEYSHYVLSEAPFVVLVLLSLVGYEATDEGEAGVDRAEGGSSGSTFWALPSAVGAYLVRSAGVPLLAAAALHQALRRRWKALGWTAGLGGAAVAGWSLVQRTGGAEESYFQQLLMRNPYDPAAGTMEPVELVGRAARNLWTYASDVVSESVLGSQLAESAGGAGLALGVALSLLALWGWLSRCERRPGVTELFFPLYLALILLWPEEWTDRRFLLPVLPLVLLYALHAVHEQLERRRPRWSGPGVTAVALAVALPAVLSAARLIPERARCLTAYWRDDPCVSAGWSSFFAAAEWTRTGTPEGAVVISRKPRIFYWLSGRRGDVFPYSREPTIVMNGIREAGADYVVVDPLFTTTSMYLVPAIRAHAARFESVYSRGRPVTVILRYRPEPPAALGPGRGESSPGEGTVSAGRGRGGAGTGRAGAAGDGDEDP